MQSVSLSVCLPLVRLPPRVKLLSHFESVSPHQKCDISRCWSPRDSNTPSASAAASCLVPHRPVALRWEGVNYHICTSFLRFICSPVMFWQSPIMKGNQGIPFKPEPCEGKQEDGHRLHHLRSTTEHHLSLC